MWESKNELLAIKNDVLEVGSNQSNRLRRRASYCYQNCTNASVCLKNADSTTLRSSENNNKESTSVFPPLKPKPTKHSLLSTLIELDETSDNQDVTICFKGRPLRRQIPLQKFNYGMRLKMERNRAKTKRRRLRVKSIGGWQHNKNFTPTQMDIPINNQMSIIVLLVLVSWAPLVCCQSENGLCQCQNGASCVRSDEITYCSCPIGFTGLFCQQLVANCKPNPCANGGFCAPAGSSYDCYCSPGYSGYHCTINDDDCASNPCLNGASCTDLVNGFRCDCRQPFVGDRCQLNRDPCQDEPCANGASCLAVDFVSFQCRCPAGYTGHRCLIDVDDCRSVDCGLRKVCVDLVDGFRCDCRPGFFGDDCTEQQSSCEPNPCLNGGQCALTGTSGQAPSYRCYCQDPFFGDHCEQQTEPCSPTTCFNGGTCVPVEPTQNETLPFRCECPGGFAGDQCQRAAGLCDQRPCGLNGVCQQLAVDQFLCLCNDGFTGELCQQTEDACSQQPCLNNGTCLPIGGDGDFGYTCLCPAGWLGGRCEIDVDECSQFEVLFGAGDGGDDGGLCRNGGICVNTYGSFVCLCGPYWTGSKCESDVLECNLSDTCGPNGRCVERLGAPSECLCDVGFTGPTCIDQIDDCASSPCRHAVECLDLTGDYQCNCRAGWEGKNCDVCILCANGGRCVNESVAEPACSCSDAGYTGRFCEVDLWACRSQPCANGGSCFELGDGRFNCSCQSGWTGDNCSKDVDECSLLVLPCQHSGTCRNTNGSFQCDCPSGYSGQNCSIDVDDCAENRCQNGACIDLVDGFLCNCAAGFTGQFCETDIEECNPNPCRLGGTCHEPGPGQFVCTCANEHITGERCHVVGEISFDRPTFSPVGFVGRPRGYLTISLRFRTSWLLANESAMVLLYGHRPDAADFFVVVLQRPVAVRVDGLVSGRSIVGSTVAIGNVDGGVTSEFVEGVLNVELFPNSIDFTVTNELCLTPLSCRGSGRLADGVSLTADWLAGFEYFVGGADRGRIWTARLFSAVRSFVGCLSNLTKTDFPILVDSQPTSLILLPNETDETTDNQLLDGLAASGLRVGCSALSCSSANDRGQLCFNGGQCLNWYSRLDCQCSDGFVGRHCARKNIITMTETTFLYLPIRETLPTGPAYASLRNLTFSMALSSPNQTAASIFYTVSGASLLFYLNASNLILEAKTESLTKLRLSVQLPNDIRSIGWLRVTVIVDDNKATLSLYDSDGRQRLGHDELAHRLDALPRAPIMFGTLHEDPAVFRYWQYELRRAVGLELAGVSTTGVSACLGDLFANELAVNWSDAMPSPLANDPPAPLDGCKAMDKCRQSSCTTGGDLLAHCLPIWNGFQCNCSSEFVNQPNQPDYGCNLVESHSFNGRSSFVLLRLDAVSTDVVGGGTVRFRTRNRFGTVLFMRWQTVVGDDLGSLEVAVYRSQLQVRVSFAGVATRSFLFNVSSSLNASDGRWHEVFWIVEPSLISLDFDGFQGRLDWNSVGLERTVSLFPFETSPIIDVYVGAKPFLQQLSGRVGLASWFHGCVSELRFGDSLQWISRGDLLQDVRDGCIGDDVCASRPCKINADCIDQWNQFQCRCKAGWLEPDCQLSIDDCLGNPCLNGGTCVDGHLNYTCTCPPGYTGGRCDEVGNSCQVARPPDSCNATGTLRCEPSGLVFSCVCRPGYTGQYCDRDIDECSSLPCLNGGTCLNRLNNFSCNCLSGFFGRRCQFVDICMTVSPNQRCQNAATCQRNNDNTNFTCQCQPTYIGQRCETYNFCYSNPCENDATCLNGRSEFSCQCAAGFRGRRCNNVDRCSPTSPCLYGTDCRNVNDSYQCLCQPYLRGRHCEQVMDACALETTSCQNGGTCHFDVTRPELGMNCSCPVGYTGRRCEMDIDECRPFPCRVGSTCVDLVGNFSCLCPAGYTGRQCQVDIDDCVDEPCLNGGVCLDDVGRYVCACRSGFEGTQCQYDVRYCESFPCQNGGTCRVVDRSLSAVSLSSHIRCHCADGWQGSRCESSVDDCVGNQCRNGAICRDGHQGYSCLCAPGYSGRYCEHVVDGCYRQPCQNGATCQYIGLCSCSHVNVRCGWHDEDCQLSECASPCIARNLSTICHCDGTGYMGPTCDDDINECQLTYYVSSDDPLPTTGVPTGRPNDLILRLGPCRLAHQCANVIGSFFCNCSGSGFDGPFCDQDVDECQLNSTELRRLGLGQLVQLPPDAQLASSTSTTPNTPLSESVPLCLHGGQCTNLVGSFRCSCPAGFTGQRCELDLNECNETYPAPTSSSATPFGVQLGPCSNGGLCVNTVGSFDCFCNGTGYGDQFCTTNVNECLTSTTVCANKAICVDTIGSFRCVCNPGWTGQLCDTDVNDCSNEFSCDHGQCINEEGSFSCNCTGTGYDGLFCERQINECQTGQHRCAHIDYCRDRTPFYVCICPAHLTGQFCEEVIAEPDTSARDGATAAAVVVILLVLILIVTAIVWYICRRRKLHGAYRPQLIENKRALPMTDLAADPIEVGGPSPAGPYPSSGYGPSPAGLDERLV